MNVFFIDSFTMPLQAKQAFFERANINRNIIKALPGFIEDNFYEQQSNDAYKCVTVAVWQDEVAYANASKTVVEEYKKQGFDMPAFTKQLGIQVTRGIYTKVTG